VYSAAKAFVNQFSQAFDFEMKKYGIRILTLCPGMVDTDFQTRAGGSRDEKQFGLMTALFVADQMWMQIERCQSLLTIDWKYRILTLFSRLLPKRWVAEIIERNIENRLLPK